MIAFKWVQASSQQVWRVIWRKHQSPAIVCLNKRESIRYGECGHLANSNMRWNVDVDVETELAQKAAGLARLMFAIRDDVPTCRANLRCALQAREYQYSGIGILDVGRNRHHLYF